MLRQATVKSTMGLPTPVAYRQVWVGLPKTETLNLGLGMLGVGLRFKM